ncbi:MAG: hypothetical protein GY867_09590 [bacterium]|nr:hypothetical protein [bacterium]
MSLSGAFAVTAGLLLFAAGGLLVSSPLAQDKIDAYISLDSLRSTGEDWNVVFQDIEADRGRVTLQHDNWLMCFLHWRTLDSAKRDLSVEYVQHHLLNFWGPDMPFELTGTSGSVTVAGHDAYFVDGTIYEGAIKTRFVVWNCDQTGRQFTSDCNINKSLGTADDRLDLQYAITRTICCHDGCESKPNEELPQPYSAPEWQVSFQVPSEWRTSVYEDKKWFPEGPSQKSASLWTLLTNSQKHVELCWNESRQDVSAGLMTEMLDGLLIDTTAPGDSSGIVAYALDSVYVSDGRPMTEGSFQMLETAQGERYIDKYRFIASLGQAEERTFLLLAGLVDMTDVWGRQVNLTPSQETLAAFFENTVVPSVRVF